MLNMLLIEENVKYAKQLISLILKKEENIRLVDIALDNEEATEILNKYKIDIILLDIENFENELLKYSCILKPVVSKKLLQIIKKCKTIN